MSQPDSTAPPELDFPPALHKLAAHLTEHGCGHAFPVSIYPDNTGFLIAYAEADRDPALRLMASLTERKSVRVSPLRSSHEVATAGLVVDVPVRVRLYLPVDDDSVASVRSRVESELAALAGEPVTAGSVTA